MKAINLATIKQAATIGRLVPVSGDVLAALIETAEKARHYYDACLCQDLLGTFAATQPSATAQAAAEVAEARVALFERVADFTTIPAPTPGEDFEVGLEHYHALIERGDGRGLSPEEFAEIAAGPTRDPRVVDQSGLSWELFEGRYFPVWQ